MSSDGNPIFGLVATFGLMSLFAVGGANAAIPEMHRIAVDVHHWLTDKQFADVFAIAQLSPGRARGRHRSAVGPARHDHLLRSAVSRALPGAG